MGAANTLTIEEPESVPEPEQETTEPGPAHESEREPLPVHLAEQLTPTPTDNTAQQPYQIPFNDDEYEQPTAMDRRGLNVI
eukprot:CCRYP_004862-RA/>CCRYP_004862-RA protein AED:0.84 eAED:0.45 QI:0/-1/0/1/-1/1/1/0/80